MIHIATVHWETDKWVDIQLRYLQQNIKQPFRIYAFLSGDAVKHRAKYYFSNTEHIKEHAVKLNRLAKIIEQSAEFETDPLIFIDGDAFPVKPLDFFIEQTLSNYPLAAIQRLENVGDTQPHPSFCITTVGFWKRINGDWTEGFEWINAHGDLRTDVGGNLLKILNDLKIKWKPLLRTSQLSEHPVMFGIYENIVYHHGAGFRVPLSRYDRVKSLETVYGNKLVAKILNAFTAKLSLKNKFRMHRLLGIQRKLIDQNIELSNKLYLKILNGTAQF